MKKILYIVLLSSFFMNAQEHDTTRKWKLELGYTTDIINTSFGKHYGFVFKAKRKLLESKKITLMVGAAYQNSFINEDENMFTGFVDGYTRDLSVVGLVDFSFYPFNKRRFYMSIQPFLGYTNLKSKGSLYIDHLGVYEKYKNSHSYFNYGMINSLGYTFNRITITFDVWSSLKGIVDSGRFRPGDFDSRLFFGMGIGYTL
ncbi:hypothetical protein NH341_03685 [Tenacibaculum sp. XPcli2-G]|uniref:hypothetical protein n=1 Tax=Tenacibaculum sp. XPcli2-G TaxID=2954503 RepID=UPI002097E6FC|nr:hypothetical protein [Tenacibaculum sp. XPcli2-G]MCO7184511.1 hypothetical protein [Tenacibaculum sp. XPcli2-G]BFF39018.1 hypothetical protein BACY1_08230 [Tenacibaculum mesophilum]